MITNPNKHQTVLESSIILSKYMQLKIQNSLISQFPVYQDKKQFLKYYVCFEFPQKQQELLAWWKQKIDFVVEHSSEVFLSPSDLKIIFTIQGLKPTPLEQLLDHLQKINWIIWKDRPNNSQKGFLQNMMGYIWKQSDSHSALDDTHSKITTRKYYEYLNQEMMSIVRKMEKYEGHILEQRKVEAEIRESLKISNQAIRKLFAELQSKEVFVNEVVGGQKVIIFSKFTDQLQQKAWREVEKNKYLLNMKIEEFDYKINSLYKEERAVLEEAKSEIENGRKMNIKQRYIIPAQYKRKKAQSLQTRKNLLEQTLHQLETQQIDNITLDFMKDCQDLINKNMRDTNQVQQILIKNKQNKERQEQINEAMKEMGEDDEQNVEMLLKQLETEIKKGKSEDVEFKVKQQRSVDPEMKDETHESEYINKDIDFV